MFCFVLQACIVIEETVMSTNCHLKLFLAQLLNIVGSIFDKQLKGGEK